MVNLKCKMCGGDLLVEEGSTVCECEYCGTRQTVPTADNEKKMTLFGRANRLRFACEFDKAAGIYETIVAEFPEEAEAYWGLVLCKYGIEYVDDPATAKKVPTCHRSSFDSVMKDSNFEQACENADPIARRLYRDEAKTMEELRKGIIEVSGKEEPYDIFICYKETDENGERTLDSVLAQDVYDALTEKGYRVFFSRISLEDKLGVEYEPYIFAALHSAKIMLAFGTGYEYYNAVWVKNEWSRFLQLMTTDKEKHLIPCYKNIDAYDMPEEFAKLQAQDLGKVGAVQDLLRGIEKLIGNKEETGKAEPVIVKAESPGIASLLKRGELFLEDQDWKNADEYFDRGLDIDPEYSDAYVGKLCVIFQTPKLEALQPTDAVLENGNYQKAVRFTGPDQIKKLEALADAVTEQKKEAEYAAAMEILMQPYQRKQYQMAEKILISLGEYKDSAAKAVNCREKMQKLEEEWQQKLQQGQALYESKGKLIAAGDTYTLGVTEKGFVLTTENCTRMVSQWDNIVAVATSDSHVVGLHADGTVTAAGKNTYDQCKVTEWKHIAAVAAGSEHTVGLRLDGTAVAVGRNDYRQCEVKTWDHLTALAAGAWYTVGLRDNGTVVITQTDLAKWPELESWNEIIELAAADDCLFGLQKDGTVR